MKKNLLFALAALLPLLCYAQPANDNCNGAIALPVNPGTAATNFVTGNFNNATGGTTGFCFSPYNDLWYHFTAVNSLHLLTVNNVTQVSALYIEVRSGSCTGGYVHCGSSNLPAMGALLSNLVPGQEYYVRVYTQAYTVPADTTFQLSLTSADPGITTSNTQYTTTQLVEDVFAAQPGLTISNITSSTGSDLTATDPNGIAYFESDGDLFPFENGIILSTGNALEATGPNAYTLNGGGFSWPGDEDLDEIINELDPTFESRNATSLEFDFVPSYDQLSLNFIFASEEYGDFQCSFSDSFAILLTDTATGAVYNLAVIPGSTTAINVSTVRNVLYNELCPSVNPQYFGQYYTPFSLEGPTNYNGQTIAFNATANVLPYNIYHLKIVIADRADPAGDSALFLQGGSFNIGEPVYNGPYVIFDNLEPYETCEENTDGVTEFNMDWVQYIIEVVGNPNSYTFTSYATEADAQQGVNPLPSAYTNTTPYEQTIYVRVSPIDNPLSFDVAPLVLKVYDMPVATPADYYVCDENNDGIAVFDLTSQLEALYGPNAGNYFYSYYYEEEGANAGGFYIDNPEAYYNQTNPQTVYIRAESVIGVCVTYAPLTLHVVPAPPAPTGTSPQVFYEGQSLANLDVTGTGISWFTAAMGGTSLPPDTPLQDGVTYYAAQLTDNCAGLDRLAVTVNLAAGLNGNTLATLRCYPNPAKNELMLEHTTTLLNATLYNTLGQKVLSTPINNTKATINTSGLASGVYLLKVQAEGGERVMKVMKE
jgi:Secretion system C-terminal sorting domain